jgi:hypothetical protein
MVGYDFETTRIQAGTPDPVWLTAYGERPQIALETAVRNFKDLHRILTTHFLIEEMHGVKFVAWAGNNFDVFFIAVALIGDSRFVLRPYLTRSNSVRGLRVSLASDGDTKTGRSWEFLDGQAMLGLVTVSLAAFLEKFAPSHHKLTGTIDFEKEEFDPANPAHRAYAFRDSEGLYHGMVNAQRIMLDRFNQSLAVTMGGACIRIFKANIPRGVEVPTPRDEVLCIIRDFVMRGGYCYCVRPYSGSVWKYDLNQAYAAAMREARLPCGFTTYTRGAVPDGATCYVVRLDARKAGNAIPFYYRTERAGRVVSAFGGDIVEDTWITSIEHAQLIAEGWSIEVRECWSWESSFDMREYVDKLETARSRAEGGPSGPIGTMIKNVGNHSYGKTVEQLEPLEFIVAQFPPDGWVPYYGDGDSPLENVHCRFVEDQREKDYHQPQIGAFITAHVRMVVRRAALLAPDAWLYADTDCVIFSRDVTAGLDIDPARYGAWKIEEAGALYQLIAKKVYSQIADDSAREAWFSPDPKIAAEVRKRIKRSAKGLNVRRLTPQDFDAWIQGRPPVQQQVQRNNFLAVMQGAEMFRLQQRAGTAIVPTPEA